MRHVEACHLSTSSPHVQTLRHSLITMHGLAVCMGCNFKVFKFTRNSSAEERRNPLCTGCRRPELRHALPPNTPITASSGAPVPTVQHHEPLPDLHNVLHSREGTAVHSTPCTP